MNNVDTRISLALYRSPTPFAYFCYFFAQFFPGCGQPPDFGGVARSGRAFILLQRRYRIAQPVLDAPATITFIWAGLYLEGVQYAAANKRFLVTSLTTGQVGQVKDDGTYSTAFPGDIKLLPSVA